MHRTRLLTGAAALAVSLSLPAGAQVIADAPAPGDDRVPVAVVPAAVVPTTDDGDGRDVVVSGAVTRSVAQIGHGEMQKALPGISPLKALQTLPGVTYLTADPWGNTEQNISMFIHGFTAQQLGYTLDGVPLGDQQYGNYNGLSPQRAIISENVGRVTLASGAGDLGTASTSNLGGTIDTFSSDPRADYGVEAQRVMGSGDAARSYLRLDSGDIGQNTRLYVSGARQRARAWDLSGLQQGWQGNVKSSSGGGGGRLTTYLAYSNKVEINEDAVVVAPTQRFRPYIRPHLFPDAAKAQLYYGGGIGFNNAPSYAAAGGNYSNYYDVAHRIDTLGYARYDRSLGARLRWSNMVYFHRDRGVGMIAGPLAAPGLPLIFSLYFAESAGAAPGATDPLARVGAIVGGGGMVTRATEYAVDRYGGESTLSLALGAHQVELGGWYEHQRSSSYRRWYPFHPASPSVPYRRPWDDAPPLITQYGSAVGARVVQLHLQDAWQVAAPVTLQAGIKTSLQIARQHMAVQPIRGSFPGASEFPQGRIATADWFLPQGGARWELTRSEEWFLNVQRNMRQFQTSASAPLSPFALGSQALFDYFASKVRPETSWTSETGMRTHRTLGGGAELEAQVSYYRVRFADRLLARSPTATISPYASSAPIIDNVGGVTTHGVDVAGTLRLADVAIYDALSYNCSSYDRDYTTGAAQTVVPTAGKKVPGSPEWLNKTVATLRTDGVELQLIGDYLGKRYATYTNDLSVKGYFTLSGRIGFDMPVSGGGLAKKLGVSLNVTNLTDQRGASTISIGAASGTYNVFPVAPRQVFATISAGF